MNRFKGKNDKDTKKKTKDFSKFKNNTIKSLNSSSPGLTNKILI